MQKLWDSCDVPRDDGLSYGGYLEQLTYQLFLKMADEQHELLGGDDSLEDIDNLPPPAVLAAEIAEDLQSALAEIQALTEALSSTAGHEAQG